MESSQDLVSGQPVQAVGVGVPVGGRSGGDTTIVVEIYALGSGITLVGESGYLPLREGAFELEANGKVFVFDPLGAVHTNGLVASVQSDIAPVRQQVEAVDQEHLAKLGNSGDSQFESSEKTVILCLPQGLGKTQLAAPLARALGCSSIVDDWNALGEGLSRGALHLTSSLDAGEVQTPPTLAIATPLPPLPGQYWPEQHGYYAGIQTSEDGKTGWHLILPDAPECYFVDVIWGLYGEDVVGAVSEFDGLPNTLAMAAAGSDLAQRIRALPDDCYLPSRFESALLYATCHAHIEDSNWHFTSTQYNASDAWSCTFDDGSQFGYLKSYEGSAVAVRRV
jgi:hypothetical protein